MPSQLKLSFEQALLDATRETREARTRTIAEAKRKEGLARLSLRLTRENARRQRTPDQVALCGPYYYNRSPRSRALGNYWSNCFRCGQPLQYYDSYEEAAAHRPECKLSGDGPGSGAGPAPLENPVFTP